jgi:hypothetical protein
MLVKYVWISNQLKLTMRDIDFSGSITLILIFLNLSKPNYEQVINELCICLQINGLRTNLPRSHDTTKRETA